MFLVCSNICSVSVVGQSRCPVWRCLVAQVGRLPGWVRVPWIHREKTTHPALGGDVRVPKDTRLSRRNGRPPQDKQLMYIFLNKF